MDFKDFSLAREDDGSYTISHPNGKSMQIEKKGLSEKAHAVIAKLKKPKGYDDGGKVAPAPVLPFEDDAAAKFYGKSDADIAARQQENQAAANFYANRAADVASGRPKDLAAVKPGDYQPDPAAITSDEIAQIPESQQLASNSPQVAGLAQVPDASDPAPAAGGEIGPTAAPAPKAAAPLPGVGNPSAGTSTNGFSQEQAGQTALAKAIGGQGKDESTAIDNTENAVAALPTQQDIIGQQKTSDAAFQNMLASQKIDPGRYLANQSTGSKIAASIGLILSGFGSGASGQKNMAQDFLEKSIDQDIDAQKNEQSKTMNLWKMNREALGTDLAANIQTKQQLYTALDHQLQKAAADARSPIAQANAQVARGQIQQKKDQLAFQQSFLNPTQNTIGNAAPGTEEAYNNHLNQVRGGVAAKVLSPEVYKDAQDRLLPGIGVAKVAPTPDDRQELTNYDTLEKYLNKAQAFQQSGPGSSIGAWTPAHRQEAAVIQQNITNSLNQLLDSKRPASKELYERYSKVVGNPGSFDIFGKNAAGLQQMSQDVGSRRQTMLTSLGVTPFAKAPADSAAIAWAQANRSDPRAAQILLKNGIH